jgi:mono/diheme cytochrome c family protein
MLIGAAIAIALAVPAGVYAFVESGVFNVAASHPHTKFTEWITHETMIHSVRRNAARIATPKRISAAQVRAGFCSYETHCVSCHGAPAIARDRWVSGMEPPPPYLLDVTSNWTPRQIFWIAKNGIKMTGMPSWRDSMPDAQIWEVVSFLEAMRRSSPQTYMQWRARRICADFKSPGPHLR